MKLSIMTLGMIILSAVVLTFVMLCRGAKFLNRLKFCQFDTSIIILDSRGPTDWLGLKNKPPSSGACNKLMCMLAIKPLRSLILC